jgi:excisionase family DNA binding protein
MPQAIESICKSDILQRLAYHKMQNEANGALHRKTQQGDNLEPAVTTIRGAASFLAVSPRAVHNYIKQGELKAVRIGGAVRIPRRHLEELIS